VICLMAVSLLAPQAHAQIPSFCPAGVTNPLTLLDGTTWSFQVQGLALSNQAAIGIFQAVVRPPSATSPIPGVLTGTLRSNQFGSVNRLQQLNGSFQIYVTCT